MAQNPSKFEQAPSPAERRENPAGAPRGFGQEAQRQTNKFEQAAGQALQQWGGPDMTAGAQGWYTGRNMEGPTSGWDTEFVQDFNRGWNQALEQGTAQSYFSDGGTGVVLWDHDQYQFGDVVEKGKVVGNVRRDYDRDTANLMLLPWLADAKEQARLWQDAPGTEEVSRRLDEFVSGKQGENNAHMESALGAMAFQSDIDETTEAIQDGAGDEALGIGTGAAGGAALGAAAGSVVPGLGTAVGATVGGIAGAIGGYLNRDEIAEAAARGVEITKLSFEENNPLAATGTALSQLGQFGMKGLSPLQNLNRGIYDAAVGETGDGVVERFAVNKRGESTVPALVKIADWGALVGDSLLQFAAPLTRALYTADMGATIGGESAQLMFSGTMFDPREGGFDNVFLDDEGGFDPVSAGAGIMKVGIDAVQLGGVRGLARQSDEVAARVARGESVERAAGFRFVLDESGKVVSKHKTMALLAPSEQIAYWTAARKARVEAANAGRAVAADDFYRAAYNLANGSNKLKTAVVNAFGEGYEEFAQAALEPLAVDGELSGKEMFTAFAYGTAGGLGMSMGATLNAPAQDARLRAQAYVIESLRNGTEPAGGWDGWVKEWEKLDPTEKRVRASRTRADVKATEAARQVIAREHSATMVASELDAAKALTAKRKKVEKELKSASEGRPDAYTVMSGLVEARMDVPAEAIEAGAWTIHELLVNRYEGLVAQEEFLANRLLELDPADPQHAEVTGQLNQASLARAWGEVFIGDLGELIDEIYDPNTPAATAEVRVEDMNRILQEVFTMSKPVNAPAGFENASAEDLAFAASQFVSLMQSREPKLDAGSYLALLPRASWTLTRERDENFLQVNNDILQAINGDFDGDKLRSENQLILSRERFAQARAGQLLGGTGRDIDIAVRKYDEALTAAVANGLSRATGPLRIAADGALTAIRREITARYGSLVSPAALDRVFESFERLVRAGSEDARMELVNGLAREAGEAITNRGKETLRNEWLWISQVVRASFNGYQTEYAKLRNLDESGNVINAPTLEEQVAEFDTPQGTEARKKRASTDAQTLSAWDEAGVTLFREFQKIHYTWFHSATLSTEDAVRVDLQQLADLYAELAQNITQNELDRVRTGDSITDRVLVMLDRLVESALETPGIRGLNPDAARTILANVKVKDVWFDSQGPVEGQGNMTLAQVLLKRALEADREEHKNTFHVDEKRQMRHNVLASLTVPNSVSGEPNAERTFIEVFKGVPFATGLGGNTGALAGQSTPEQFLQMYVAHDESGRADLKHFFTNVPEYLDRKDTSNIPYSMKEMDRGEITPYRSMMDAMLAVGNHELTFDRNKAPAEAFGGRLAKVDGQARESFREIHAQLQQALLSMRKIRNRTTGTREDNAALMQQLLAANPREGRAILDLIPDAAANALYEYRDDELYITPWLYEVLAEENGETALMKYWWNLTLAKWNSRQDEGRSYDSLTSRMERVFYRLAAESGQMNFEMLIRQAKDASTLDDLIFWINTTPGIRPDGMAPLLPFVDDVADFEGAAEGGGWGTQSASGDLRLALQTAKTAAEQLTRTMAFRETTMATDQLIVTSIRQALEGDQDPLKQQYLRQFQDAVKTARRLPRGFSPSAMLALTRGVVNGFDAGSHEKGKTSSSYKGIGEFQALMDAFAFVPGLERVLETLTAHSLSSLKTNLGDMAKHGGVAMDERGRQVEWEPLSVESALELLENPETMPLAYALLTPTAMDVSPYGLSERLLMDASLKDLLDEDHYIELFNEDSTNQLDTDTRYVSLLDAYGRSEGGHFDAVRLANSYAILKTSALGKTMTPQKQDELTAEAYHMVASVMRTVGQILASPKMGPLALDDLRKTALAALQENRKSRALPGFTDQTGKVLQEWIDDLLAGLDLDHEMQVTSLRERFTGDELVAQIEALDAQHARNRERIVAQMDDDLLGTVLARFELSGDPAVDGPQYARITEYVASMANFATRAPEAADAWQKLAAQRRAGVDIELSVAEWDVLSRAAMGVTLVDEQLRISGHTAVPAIPAGLTSDRFFKYFDPTYSWLVNELLSESSPLAEAAKWLHIRAQQPTSERKAKDMLRSLQDTILNIEEFGTWTPGLMAQLVEAQQRMDSAGAPPGIAAAGNGPKRWWAVAAATRRTGQVPTPDLLTSVTLTADMLAATAHPFNEFVVQPAGTAEPTSMPVAQLENRFFASIKIDGDEVPLDGNLGFTWEGADEPNPYRYVSLERLRPILERHALSTGKDLIDVTVEMQFFHPDSQPGGMWNNAFFEGMSHSLLPDGSESLLSTLWADNGGQISADTQWTIDAGKKGLRAIMPFRRLRPETLAEAEALWTQRRDFAGMLRRKAELAALYDDGSGQAGPEAFNALYKIMKLQHVITGTDDAGNVVVMSAEEVIAFQAANGFGAELPLNDPQLVKLSPDVLRSMLGDSGSQGVGRFFDDDIEFNADMIPAYEGISATALTRFARGLATRGTRAADTTLANIGAQRVMQVRTVRPVSERNARAERRIYLDKRSAKARDARYGRKRDSHYRETYNVMLEEAKSAVGAELTPFDFGTDIIGPKNTLEGLHTQRVLETFRKVSSATGLSRGWSVADEGAPDYSAGVLTLDTLHDDRDPENWVVKDDLALVRLASFKKPERKQAEREARLEQALDFLTDSGAYVVLGSEDGGGDLRHHAAKHLERRGYVRVPGSRHLYGPAEFVYQSQNERAYESTLTETGRITPATQAITFLAEDPIGTDENSAILNPDSVKLRTRKLLSNLIPSYSGFNIPMEDGRNQGLYVRTLAQLRTMTDPGNAEARSALLAMAGDDPRGVKPIAKALDDFHAKITRRGSLELEIGEQLAKGDIIPFVNAAGKIILYRHGMESPRPRDLPKLFRTNGMNIALATSKTAPQATANSGTIVDVETRPGYSRRLVLEEKLQAHGDKVQLEWNGMKYVVVPKPTSMGKIPKVFRNGTVVDLLSDKKSADAKEARRGRINGYRNALTFFQFDFTGSKPADGDYQRRSLLVYNLLHELADQTDYRITLKHAAAISKQNVALGQFLGDFAMAQAAQGPDASWVDRLQDTSDPSTLISRAVITYLLTPGAHVDNVLKSAGFSNPKSTLPTATVREVPGLFATLLDHGLDSPLHTELIRRFNSQLVREADGSGWKLHDDWTVEMFFGSAARQPSGPPADGISGQVYHGASTALPAKLLPRGQVTSVTDNFAGKGLYTTTLKDHASTWAGQGLYRVDGSKSGKKYELFDLEQKVTAQDAAEFKAFSGGMELRDGWTWLRNFGLKEGTAEQDLITRFLEEERGAGVLRYTRGNDFDYVWLHPEDLVLVPADTPLSTGGGSQSIRGYLQFGEAHSSGDNPVLNGQAYDPTEASPVSDHNAMAAGLAIGATTAHQALEASKAFNRSFTRDGDVTKFNPDNLDNVWSMLTAIPQEKDLRLSGFRRETPAESMRREIARDEIIGFYRPLDTETWKDGEAAKWASAVATEMGRANLSGLNPAMVDTWVRDHLGRPYGLDEDGNDRSIISFDDAMQVLAKIRTNLKEGRLPTHGANLPLFDINHLTTLYLRNLDLPDSKRWKLMDGDTEVTSWDGWVEMAFGTAWVVPPGKVGVGPEPQFDQMYQLAVDGRMHGYQGATNSTRYLPVSTETLRQRQLMDPVTNRMLVSTSADENLLATDPMLWAAQEADLETILAGQRIYSPGRKGPDPHSAEGRAAIRRAMWRREVDAPTPMRRTMRGVRSEGQAFIGYTTHTSSLYRSMMNLRVGNTLFNLSLSVAAPLEALYRRNINLFANLATGEKTGAAGMAQTWLIDHIPGKNVREAMANLGIGTTLTMKQHRQINDVVHALATLPEFKAMVYKELLYAYPTVPGIGRIEKWLEAYARFGAKMQDPTLGMRQESIVRTYLEAVLKKIATEPTGGDVYSVERLLTSLPRDPMWLKKNDATAHALGLAAIANVRSTKPNVLSLAFRGIIEPLSEHPFWAVNTFGNMAKILTAFQNFWASFGTNITGLQGAVDWIAFAVDGREKKTIRRMQAAMRGEPFVESETERFDMSEALESIDLADSFIKGGVTHSALFALGMLAGGLGLDGEDDEEKFRRRQAELQGVPVLHDPRDIEADFRNKDAIYLDWLPFGMDSWFRVDPNDPKSRSLAQMNWIARTFLSPVIGMERFYKTGDFSEVWHGFKDAIGSHPIVNATLWNSASETAAYLHEQANDAAEQGDVVEAGHMLTQAVGVFERMLFENAMVNLVYIGRDEWDRDPYVLPLRDSDGDLQRDIEGNARPNDLALQNYISDVTGGVSTGYQDRSGMQADARVLTENRATMALVASLFTGGLDDSDYWRYNMPIKTRELERPDLSEETAEALVRAAVAYQLSTIGGEAAMNVTPDEMLPQVRNQLYQLGDATGKFYTDDEVWAVSRQVAAEKGVAPLSILDGANREHLTEDGMRAVFRGLKGGTISVDELGQLGVFIPYETRQKIAAEMTEELIQEGIDLGLDETKAKSRMMRLMQGGFGGPEEQAAGLADTLFDSRIPSDGTLVYGQLNTTYIMGPDGKPWATGFKRDGLLGAMGLAPLKSMIPPDPGVTGRDARGNTVDLVNGVNTGLRALVPFHDSRNIPTDEELAEMLRKAIEDAAGKTYSPTDPYDKGGDGGGSGWRNFGRRGYGGYGGGGGGGGYFSKMYSMPRNISPYGNSISAINTSNPILRRAFVRRERVSSERGRLNQWQ